MLAITFLAFGMDGPAYNEDVDFFIVFRFAGFKGGGAFKLADFMLDLVVRFEANCKFL